MSLKDVYEEYREAGKGAINDLADMFFPPLVVQPPAGWDEARHRIVWVGQETGEWIFSRENAQRWTFKWDKDAISSLKDFFENSTSIEDLMGGYESFDCASCNTTIARSPFWRYLRECEASLNNDGSSTAILFSNVIRCASNLETGYNIWNIPEPDRSRYMAWQKGLLTKELQALQPSLIIFVSGPNYDDFLHAEFDYLKKFEVGPYNARVLTKLSSDALPAPSYRTYHPSYLNRKHRFVPIAAAIEDAKST